MLTASCRSRFRREVDSKKQDLVYRIEARVTDAGNREIAGHGFALATYGSFFLTAEPNSYVYSKGGTATITVTAQDYDKKPVQTVVPRGDESLELAQRRGPGRHHLARPDRRQRQSADQADDSRLRRVSRPRHRDHAGEARRRDRRRTSGRRAKAPWWSGPTQERMQIVADKKSYQPGDTAHVLIVTGKEPTSVLVTAEGNGLYSGQVIKSSGGSIAVDVPDQAGVRAELLCWRRSSFAATSCMKDRRA